MPRSKKYNKNLEKVQNMLDGNHNNKIVVGDHSVKSQKTREVGERWTDSDGKEWEQKEGYISSVSKMPARGIFDKVCKDCESPCINKGDKDTYNRMGRCFVCQCEFETHLKNYRIGEKSNKWQFWVKLQMLRQWDAIEKDAEVFIMERHEENKTLLDKSVANALANAEIDTSMNINKNLVN